jgi:hypothetical protein
MRLFDECLSRSTASVLQRFPARDINGLTTSITQSNNLTDSPNFLRDIYSCLRIIIRDGKLVEIFAVC